MTYYIIIIRSHEEVTETTRCSNNNNFIITYRVSNDFPVQVKKIDVAFIPRHEDGTIFGFPTIALHCSGIKVGLLFLQSDHS